MKIKNLPFMIGALSSFIFGQSIAADGVVIVLEAPLFEKENINSRIVQYIRKGDHIYIHERHAGISPNEQNYGQIDTDNRSQFYLVQDKNGSEAYVERRFIKRIYKDDRERTEAISPFTHDPTDYRLKEPLPPQYPKLTDNRYRAFANLALGPSNKINYPYPKDIKSEQYGPRGGFELAYLKNVEFDIVNRFYFGVQFHFWQSNSKFILQGDNSATKEATEQNGQFGIGPFVSFDAYRDFNYRLSFTGGFTFNLNRTYITLKASDEEENRIFTAYTITPHLGTFIQLPNVLPHVDIITGASLQFHLPYTMQAQGPAVNESSWNQNNDKIDYPLGGFFTAFLGLQTTY